MDGASIAMIIGLCTLIIERTFAWINKFKKSKCCGTEIEMDK